MVKGQGHSGFNNIRRFRNLTSIASQITSLNIVYSTVYSGSDQRKHQSSASLAFVQWIHRGPVNSQNKWPVTRKMFPFDDVIMSHTCSGSNLLSTHIAFVICVIDLPIPEIRLCQNLTLKIQDQCHGWGERSRSHKYIPALIRCVSFLFHVDRSNHSYGYISISGWSQETDMISFSHELYIFMITNLTHTRPRDMARSRPPFWIFSFAAWKWVNMDGNWRNFDGNISSYV